jgi:hypothetical protein
MEEGPRAEGGWGCSAPERWSRGVHTRWNDGDGVLNRCRTVGDCADCSVGIGGNQWETREMPGRVVTAGYGARLCAKDQSQQRPWGESGVREVEGARWGVQSLAAGGPADTPALRACGGRSFTGEVVAGFRRGVPVYGQACGGVINHCA